jgi:hypothetical protein
MPKVSIRPMGENQPNLVTLVGDYFPAGLPDSLFSDRKLQFG